MTRRLSREREASRRFRPRYRTVTMTSFDVVDAPRAPVTTGSKHLVEYTTTKGGNHALAKSLAQLLLARGIRVDAGA